MIFNKTADCVIQTILNHLSRAYCEFEEVTGYKMVLWKVTKPLTQTLTVEQLRSKKIRIVKLKNENVEMFELSAANQLLAALAITKNTAKPTNDMEKLGKVLYEQCYGDVFDLPLSAHLQELLAKAILASISVQLTDGKHRNFSSTDFWLLAKFYFQVPADNVLTPEQITQVRCKALKNLLKEMSGALDEKPEKTLQAILAMQSSGYYNPMPDANVGTKNYIPLQTIGQPS